MGTRQGCQHSATMPSLHARNGSCGGARAGVVRIHDRMRFQAPRAAEPHGAHLKPQARPNSSALMQPCIAFQLRKRDPSQTTARKLHPNSPHPNPAPLTCCCPAPPEQRSAAPRILFPTGRLPVRCCCRRTQSTRHLHASDGRAVLQFGMESLSKAWQRKMQQKLLGQLCWAQPQARTWQASQSSQDSNQFACRWLLHPCLVPGQPAQLPATPLPSTAMPAHAAHPPAEKAAHFQGRPRGPFSPTKSICWVSQAWLSS